MTAPSPPLTDEQVAEWAAMWLNQCGPCDAGLPTSCACPDADPRQVIAALIADRARLTERLAEVEAEVNRSGARRLARDVFRSRAEAAEAERDDLRAVVAKVEPFADALAQMSENLRAALATKAALAGTGAQDEADHECDTGYFDRTLCGCGAMHSYCATCGKRADHCPTHGEHEQGEEGHRG